MAKPTLLQSLLGRPSQTYHFPPHKDYYSTRQDLLRAATESSAAAAETQPVLRPVSGGSPQSTRSGSTTPSQSRPSSPRRRSLREAETASRRDSTNSRHSKSRPPSLSLSSANSLTEIQTDTTRFTPSTTYTTLSGQTSPAVTPLSSIRRDSGTSERSPKPTSPSSGLGGGSETSLGEESSTDDEVFYTPRSTLYGSPRTSRASGGSMLIDPKVLTNALLPLPGSPLSASNPSIRSKSSVDGLSPHGIEVAELPISRTPSESSFSSSTSSSSTEETVRSHATGTSLATNSTRITTPVTSDYGVRRSEDRIETITIASSNARSPPDPQQQVVRGKPRPLALTSTRRRRPQSEQRRQTYTDEDWAKDVRWLAPVDPVQPESSRRPSRTLPPDIAIPDLTAATTAAAPRLLARQSGPRSYPPPAPSAELRRRSRRSKGSRSSRGRMSALLEEDESEYSDSLTPTSSSASTSRAPSPVPEEDPSPEGQVPLSTSPLGATIDRTPSRKSHHTSSDEATETPDVRLQKYARSNGQPRRPYSNTRRLSRSISPTLDAFVKSLPTHSIPAPVPASEPAPAHGYTTLTLPHATNVSNGKAALVDGKVDLVRAGIAPSSMATVEVTRGVAQLHTPSEIRRKRRTISFAFSLKFLDVKGLAKAKGKGREGLTPAHLLDSLPLPVEFTAHIPPPSSIPSQHVLIQVFAVGIDSLDSLLVHEKASLNGKGAGFIPGRSVVGKVIEMGWEVKEDVCRKGEWVIGLLDVRKSGALAQFIVVERHRVFRAPQPAARPATFLPQAKRGQGHARSASLPTHLNNKHPFSQIHRDLLASTSLSLEELALLPLCALPAHRAIRTLQDVIAPAKPRPDDPAKAKKPRILVLQGHDGAGALAVQMLARRGVRVTVQVPDSAARDDTNEDDDESEDEDDAVEITIRRKGSNHPNGNGNGNANGNGSAKVRQTRFDRLDARLRSWGAEEICVGEPHEILERFAEHGRSFDAVLDSVGGVDVWEMSRRILLADPEHDPTNQDGTTTPMAPTSPGSTTKPVRASSSSNKRTFTVTQFTTLVGDTPSRPVPNAQDNFRSGFRSLKRTMSTARERSRSPSPNRSTTNLSLGSRESIGQLLGRNGTVKGKAAKRTVSYAWVCAAADVDFAGEDVRDSLGAVISMVEEGWIRPWIGDEIDGVKVVPFDKAPEVFRRHGDSPVGLLKDGGTCVVKLDG